MQSYNILASFCKLVDWVELYVTGRVVQIWTSEIQQIPLVFIDDMVTYILLNNN